MGKYIKNQRYGSFRMPEGGQGDLLGAQAPWWRDTTLGHAGGPPGLPGPPLLPPSPIFTPRDETLEDRTLFRDPFSVLPPSPFQDRGCQETLSRHPAGGRIDLRELLHHHERFPDEP